MASMIEITCKCGYGRKRMVRTADVKRGWGKFFDKSCKASFQERNTHQCRDYYRRIDQRDECADEGFCMHQSDYAEGHVQ